MMGGMLKGTPRNISGPVMITSPYDTLGVILLVLEMSALALGWLGPYQ